MGWGGARGEAVRWLRKAAQSGHAGAAAKLAGKTAKLRHALQGRVLVVQPGVGSNLASRHEPAGAARTESKHLDRGGATTASGARRQARAMADNAPALQAVRLPHFVRQRSNICTDTVSFSSGQRWLLENDTVSVLTSVPTLPDASFPPVVVPWLGMDDGRP
eukprot:SAG31_NODE_4354_length_3319_cov_6.317081_2_plen_162_part_00